MSITNNLQIPLPSPEGRLEGDVHKIIQAFGIIDRELSKTMLANMLLADNGLGLYDLLMSILETAAKNTNRLNRLELEFIKFAGGGQYTGDGSGENTGYYDEDGTYVGPIAVGNDIMGLTKAGVMLLFDDEQVDTQGE